MRLCQRLSTVKVRCDILGMWQQSKHVLLHALELGYPAADVQTVMNESGREGSDSRIILPHRDMFPSMDDTRPKTNNISLTYVRVQVSELDKLSL